MTDPVNETPKPKKGRRSSKNGKPADVVSPPSEVMQGGQANEVVVTDKQAIEFAEVAIQATKYGPNPGFLQGQPIALVKGAIRASMPVQWKEKGAGDLVLQITDPSLLVIMLTYFAAYWNLGFRVGFEHGKRTQEKK